MMKSAALLLLLFFLAGGSADLIDRRCGSDLSHLWLDVVTLIDTSTHTTQVDLSKIASNIESVFSAGTRIGIDPSDPRTTRVGLVTYDWDSTVVDNLNQFHNGLDLHNGLSRIKLGHSSDSNLADGLNTAWNVFSDGSKNSTRLNYKRVIIVYTNYFDPQHPSIRVATQLKLFGITIITMALSQDADLLKNLALISSPRLSFTISDCNVIGEVQQALLDVNCFCPQSWIQYTTETSTFGVCVRPINLNAVWRAARSSCQNRIENGYMLNEYSQEKHDFVWNLVQNTAGFSQPIAYHLGMFVSNGVYVWDQPRGSSNPPLSSQNWTDWNGGVPVPSSSLSAVQVLQKGTISVWQPVAAFNAAAGYVCEVAACDTDNYC